MHFSTICAGNLLRRPMRTLLTCLGVALGMASLVALVGLSNGVEHAWTTGLSEKGTQVLGMRKGAAEILTATLAQDLEPQIHKTRGIRDVSGELIDLIQVGQGSVVLLSGWPKHSFLWGTLDLIEGNIEDTGDQNRVVMGQSLAQALGEKKGDTIMIGGRSFEIAAIYRARGSLNNNTIVMPLGAMQRLTGKKGQVTVFNIRLENNHDPASVEKMVSSLNERFDRITFQETGQVADNNKILKLFRAIAWGTSAIAILICLFVVVNTLLMSVTERRREIGVLSALGWHPVRIMSMIGMEAFMLTVFGALAGIALGVSGMHFLVRMTELRAYIEPGVSFVQLLNFFLIVVGLGTAAGIYPAWRAIRINPTRALRYE